MTDEERAARMVRGWWPDKRSNGQNAEMLAAEFAAVRAEERAKVVAWLRRHTYAQEAAMIERGDHDR